MKNTKTIWRPNQKNIEYTTEEIADEIAEQSLKDSNWMLCKVDPDGEGVFEFINKDPFTLMWGIYLIKLCKWPEDMLLYVGMSVTRLYGRFHRFWRTYLGECTPKDGPHGCAEGLLKYEEKIGKLDLGPKENDFSLCRNLKFFVIDDIDLNKIKTTEYFTDVHGASTPKEPHPKKTFGAIEKHLINKLNPVFNKRGKSDPNKCPEVLFNQNDLFKI